MPGLRALADGVGFGGPGFGDGDRHQFWATTRFVYNSYGRHGLCGLGVVYLRPSLFPTCFAFGAHEAVLYYLAKPRDAGWNTAKLEALAALFTLGAFWARPWWLLGLAGLSRLGVLRLPHLTVDGPGNEPGHRGGRPDVAGCSTLPQAGVGVLPRPLAHGRSGQDADGDREPCRCCWRPCWRCWRRRGIRPDSIWRQAAAWFGVAAGPSCGGFQRAGSLWPCGRAGIPAELATSLGYARWAFLLQVAFTLQAYSGPLLGQHLWAARRLVGLRFGHGSFFPAHRRAAPGPGMRVSADLFRAISKVHA